jgi:chorismate synthase
MNNIGNNIKLTFFGESHGKFLGVVLDQIPAGIKLDFELLDFNLSKRRPDGKISTSRIENDNYEIVSGFKNGYTTGAALTFLVPNKDYKKGDYDSLDNVPRPGHSDFPAHFKYDNYNDKSGGGIFSGRLTVLWVIVGSVCQQILEKKNIYVGSHIESIKNVYDNSFDRLAIEKDLLIDLNKSFFPLINNDIKPKMTELIEKTKSVGDSLGGTIESAVINLPIGLGEPLFLSVESYLSNLLFSIPAIKGIEFGEGFNLARMNGSESNDQYEYKEGKIAFLSNNNGGILGGLSTGQPLIIRLAVKPTSSISKKQMSIDLEKHTNVELVINGRHDPQIVSRVLQVINSVINFAILDLFIYTSNKSWYK